MTSTTTLHTAGGPWFSRGAQQFVDRRMRLTRNSGLVYQHVRAYHGVIVRKDPEKRNQIYDYCPHAHAKQSAATKCAEAAAKRLNRAVREAEG